MDDFGLPTKRGKQGPAAGVTVMDIDNANMYRPRTRETREAYEALLAVIHQQFGEQPQVCRRTHTHVCVCLFEVMLVGVAAVVACTCMFLHVHTHLHNTHEYMNMQVRQGAQQSAVWPAGSGLVQHAGQQCLSSVKGEHQRGGDQEGGGWWHGTGMLPLACCRRAAYSTSSGLVWHNSARGSTVQCSSLLFGEESRPVLLQYSWGCQLLSLESP